MGDLFAAVEPNGCLCAGGRRAGEAEGYDNSIGSGGPEQVRSLSTSPKATEWTIRRSAPPRRQLGAPDRWIAEHLTMGYPDAVRVSVARSKCMLTCSRLTLWSLAAVTDRSCSLQRADRRCGCFHLGLAVGLSEQKYRQGITTESQAITPALME